MSGLSNSGLILDHANGRPRRGTQRRANEHRNLPGGLDTHPSGHSKVKFLIDHSAAELHDLGGRLREAVGLGARSAGRPDLEASHEPDSTSQ